MPVASECPLTLRKSLEPDMVYRAENRRLRKAGSKTEACSEWLAEIFKPQGGVQSQKLQPRMTNRSGGQRAPPSSVVIAHLVATPDPIAHSHCPITG
jgi:hypothetical protein